MFTQIISITITSILTVILYLFLARIWLMFCDQHLSWAVAGTGLSFLAGGHAFAVYSLVGSTHDLVQAGRYLFAFFTAIVVALVLWRASTANLPAYTAPTKKNRRPAFSFIKLNDGRRLAFWAAKSVHPVDLPPAVFLHGGPGGMVSGRHIDITGRAFVNAGLNFYAYDQAGCGASDLVPDPRNYTVDLMVEDLEAVRRHLGVAHIILVAGSWGTVIAANYAMRFPERSAALVFFSPVSYKGIDYGSLDFSKTDQQRFPGLGPLRLTLATALIRVAPILALNFMTQEESRLWAPLFVRRQLSGAMHCAGLNPRDPQMGMDFNLYPAIRLPQDIRKHRRWHDSVQLPPTLVWRGECDYLPRSVSETYIATSKMGRIIDVPNEGHAVANPTADRAAQSASWLREIL